MGKPLPASTYRSAQMRSKTLALCFACQAGMALVCLVPSRMQLLARKRDCPPSSKALPGMLHRGELPLPTEAYRLSYLAG